MHECEYLKMFRKFMYVTNIILFHIILNDFLETKFILCNIEPFQILAGKRSCAQYDAELLRVKTSPEVRRYNEEHADLYKYTSEHSGNKIHDAESLEFLYNTLFIEELYNFTLPIWTQKVFPEQMVSVASYSFTIPAKTQILQRLKIGKLLWECELLIIGVVRHGNSVKATTSLQLIHDLFSVNCFKQSCLEPVFKNRNLPQQLNTWSMELTGDAHEG